MGDAKQRAIMLVQINFGRGVERDLGQDGLSKDRFAPYDLSYAL